MWVRLSLPTPVCPLKSWSGIPCATCGTTRLVDALLSGDPIDAFSFNPLVFCCLALIAGCGLLSTVGLAFDLATPRLVLSPTDRGRLLLLAAAAVIANWVYLLVRGI